MTRTLNNLHNNVTFEPAKIVRLKNTPKPGQTATPSKRRRIGQKAIETALGDAGPAPVRALGAGWSLSHAADTSGRLLQTEGLSFTKVGLKTLHPESRLDPKALAWVQCGTRVAQLNVNLGLAGRSLCTSGASNGQTIVGATATGTHGSAFQVGAMHDTIVAMHIVCDDNRSVWLEDKSAPVVSDTLIKRACGKNVEIIRHNNTFRSALVSFGSFGIVESVVIKTEPLYLLSVHRETRPWNAALQAQVQSFDLSQEEDPALGKLYHFDVVFSPEQVARGKALTPWVTRIYKTPAPRGFKYKSAKLPKNVIITDPAAVSYAAAAAQLAPRLMISQTQKVLERRFPLLDGTPQVPLGVLFTDVVMDALGASTEIGVATADAPRAVRVISGVLAASFKARRPFLGPVALRFVKASKATLAFTHFGPVCCCIELPGAGVKWMPKLYDKIFDALAKAKIPYALHWGQQNNFTPENILRSYGDKRVKIWKTARARVLNTPELRARFSNQMLENCGLS